MLLASSALLLIPWLGYRFVAEMELFVRAGQERALADTARTVATVLHDRPSLLLPRSSDSGDGGNGMLRPVPALQDPIQLDGHIEDWINQGADVRAYGGEQLIEVHGAWNARSLSFSHAVGAFDGSLYAFFEVTDERVVYCAADEIRTDTCDQLRISFAGDAARYIVAAAAPGPVTALRIPADGTGQPLPEPRIAGFWRETPIGYTIEIRVAGLAVGRPAFAVVDVDDPLSRRVTAVIATGKARIAELRPAAFDPAPDLRQLVDSIAQSGLRIGIVDRQRRVILRAGKLLPPAPVSEPGSENKPGNFWQTLEDDLLRPLYRFILPGPDVDSREESVPETHLDGPEIASALAGTPTVRSRRTRDARFVIVSAVHPVSLGGRIVGAVAVEQMGQAISDLRRRALEHLLTVTLAAFALAALTLFLYASRLSTRIRRLRNEAEQAIDPMGRVLGPVSGSNAGDELGDLARSVSQVLERLAQYTDYLENMARRLGHELRTPIGIVRSSLDNLRMQKLPRETLVYLERADEGLTRLGAILTRMSESTRLEQAMKHAQRETFDLRKVVAGCVAGYRSAYPGKEINFAAAAEPIAITGVPDLIAQLLDKLIENAVDFSAKDSPIEIELRAEPTGVTLIVRNEGPPLPSEMAGRLFESMVSVRTEKNSGSPHLGLGLYIVHLVALFHYGRASAANRSDGKGVEITVRLPRYVSDPA